MVSNYIRSMVPDSTIAGIQTEVLLQPSLTQGATEKYTPMVLLNVLPSIEGWSFLFSSGLVCSGNL